MGVCNTALLYTYKHRERSLALLPPFALLCVCRPAGITGLISLTIQPPFANAYIYTHIERSIEQAAQTGARPENCGLLRARPVYASLWVYVCVYANVAAFATDHRTVRL